MAEDKSYILEETIKSLPEETNTSGKLTSEDFLKRSTKFKICSSMLCEG